MKETAIDLRGLLRQLESGVDRERRAPSRRVRHVRSQAAVAWRRRGRRSLPWRSRAGVGSAARRARDRVRRRRSRSSGSRRAASSRMWRCRRTGSIWPTRTIRAAGRACGFGRWTGRIRSSSSRRVRSAIGVSTFARDGASIFYAVKGSDDPGGSIYQIPLLGGPPRKILTGVDSPPALSRRTAGSSPICARTIPERGASALMIAGVDGSNPASAGGPPRRRNSSRPASSSARRGRRTAPRLVASVQKQPDAQRDAGHDRPGGRRGAARPDAFTDIGSHELAAGRWWCSSRAGRRTGHGQRRPDLAAALSDADRRDG